MKARVDYQAWQRTRGTSVVEFALVSVVFFLLIFSIIEIGRWVYLNNTVHLAAQESARLLVGNPDLSASEVKARVVARDIPLDPDQLVLSVSVDRRRQRVEVIAQYPYTPLLPMTPLPAGTIEVRVTLRY